MAKKGAVALGLGLGATILYLGANAVTGAQGLAAYVELQEQERSLAADLKDARAEVAELNAHAARLRGDDLDLDYLDERARELLGQSAPGELTFALNDQGEDPR